MKDQTSYEINTQILNSQIGTRKLPELYEIVRGQRKDSLIICTKEDGLYMQYPISQVGPTRRASRYPADIKRKPTVTLQLKLNSPMMVKANCYYQLLLNNQKETGVLTFQKNTD